MSDQRYDAMRHAVSLALSGRYNNWWAVAARLRAQRYREADVDWSEGQRMWLDQLCSEARQGAEIQEVVPPRPRRSALAVIEGGRRPSSPFDGGQSRPVRVQGLRLNHRLR